MTKNVIRAIYNDRIIRVYQAYSADIALPALKKGTFVSPFKMERMTWIKPSFNWMMYRSGFGRKQNQEYILSIDIERDGFEWALENSVLSSFDPNIYTSHEEWKYECAHKPVRIQWDPERDWRLRQIPEVRTIQIGLIGEAVKRYIRDWIVNIEDITSIAHKASLAKSSENLPSAIENPYLPGIKSKLFRTY